MGERITTIGKQHEMDDADLWFVYARSQRNGGVFGLLTVTLATMLAQEHEIEIEFAPSQTRVISKSLLMAEPQDIDYARVHSDVSSHGASWGHLRDMVRDLTVSFPIGLRGLSSQDLERHVDGLIGMTVEGARKGSTGMEVIAQGLFDAKEDIHDGYYWRQQNLYTGLGYIANNFAERDAYATRQLAATLPGLPGEA